MPSIPGFVGGSNVLRQPFVSCERSINIFPETIPGTGKRQKYMKSRAGLRTFATVDDSAGRGMYAENDRCFAAVGSSFAEVFENGSTFVHGSIESGTLPVRMVSNGSAGNQIFFTAYPKGYIFDLGSDTLTELSGDFPASAWQSVFFDSYFLVSIRDTRQFRWCGLNDGMTWDPLNVAERQASDKIMGFLRYGKTILILGERTSEPWYNTGDALTPFAPVQGVSLNMGCAAGFSAQRIENTVAFIGQNEAGGGCVYALDGFSPDKISTYAIDLNLQDSGNLEFVSASAFQQKGHRFYQINLPPNESDLSPVLDFGEQVWHHRGMWDVDSASYSQDLAAAHCYAFSKNLMVSRLDGTIYWLRDDAYTDQVAA
jgi:hypothetical protein